MVGGVKVSELSDVLSAGGLESGGDWGLAGGGGGVWAAGGEEVTECTWTGWARVAASSKMWSVLVGLG